MSSVSDRIGELWAGEALHNENSESRSQSSQISALQEMNEFDFDPESDRASSVSMAVPAAPPPRGGSQAPRGGQAPGQPQNVGQVAARVELDACVEQMHGYNSCLYGDGIKPSAPIFAYGNTSGGGQLGTGGGWRIFSSAHEIQMIPKYSLCVNVPSGFLAVDARVFSHWTEPYLHGSRGRALAAILSLLFAGYQQGIPVGKTHAELDHMRNGNHSEEEFEAAVERLTINRYLSRYTDAATHESRVGPMYTIGCEELKEKDNADKTVALRIWLHVFNPEANPAKMCSKVMDNNAQTTRHSRSSTLPQKRSTQKEKEVVEKRELLNESLEESASMMWASISSLSDFVNALNDAAGGNNEHSGRPIVPRSKGAQTGWLPAGTLNCMSLGYAEEDARTGASSPLDPRFLFNSKSLSCPLDATQDVVDDYEAADGDMWSPHFDHVPRGQLVGRALSAFLVDTKVDGQLLKVNPQQLDPRNYFHSPFDAEFPNAFTVPDFVKNSGIYGLHSDPHCRTVFDALLMTPVTGNIQPDNCLLELMFNRIGPVGSVRIRQEVDRQKRLKPHLGDNITYLDVMSCLPIALREHCASSGNKEIDALQRSLSQLTSIDSPNVSADLRNEIRCYGRVDTKGSARGHNRLEPRQVLKDDAFEMNRLHDTLIAPAVADLKKRVVDYIAAEASQRKMTVARVKQVAEVRRGIDDRERFANQQHVKWMDALLKLSWNRFEQSFSSDSARRTIPAGWKAIWDGFNDTMMQSTTFACDPDASDSTRGTMNMATAFDLCLSASDTTPRGAWEEMKTGVLHVDTFVSGARDPLMDEVYLTFMEVVQSCSYILLLMGSAATGKSERLVRFQELMPKGCVEKSGSGTQTSGQNGGSNAHDGCMIVYDEMPPEITTNISSHIIEQWKQRCSANESLRVRTVQAKKRDGTDTFEDCVLYSTHYESIVMATNRGHMFLSGNEDRDDSTYALVDRSIAHAALDRGAGSSTVAEMQAHLAKPEPAKRLAIFRLMSCSTAIVLLHLKHLPWAKPSMGMATRIMDYWNQCMAARFNMPPPTPRKMTKVFMVLMVYTVEAALAHRFLFKQTAYQSTDMRPIDDRVHAPGTARHNKPSHRHGKCNPFSITDFVAVTKMLEFRREDIAAAWSRLADYNPQWTSHRNATMTAMAEHFGFNITSPLQVVPKGVVMRDCVAVSSKDTEIDDHGNRIRPDARHDRHDESHDTELLQMVDFAFNSGVDITEALARKERDLAQRRCKRALMVIKASETQVRNLEPLATLERTFGVEQSPAGRQSARRITRRRDDGGGYDDDDSDVEREYDALIEEQERLARHQNRDDGDDDMGVDDGFGGAGGNVDAEDSALAENLQRYFQDGDGNTVLWKDTLEYILPTVAEAELLGMRTTTVAALLSRCLVKADVGAQNVTVPSIGTHLGASVNYHSDKTDAEGALRWNTAWRERAGVAAPGWKTTANNLLGIGSSNTIVKHFKLSETCVRDSLMEISSKRAQRPFKEEPFVPHGFKKHNAIVDGENPLEMLPTQPSTIRMAPPFENMVPDEMFEDRCEVQRKFDDAVLSNRFPALSFFVSVRTTKTAPIRIWGNRAQADEKRSVVNIQMNSDAAVQHSLLLMESVLHCAQLPGLKNRLEVNDASQHLKLGSFHVPKDSPSHVVKSLPCPYDAITMLWTSTMTSMFFRDDAREWFLTSTHDPSNRKLIAESMKQCFVRMPALYDVMDEDDDDEDGEDHKNASAELFAQQKAKNSDFEKDFDAAFSELYKTLPSMHCRHRGLYTARELTVHGKVIGKDYVSLAPSDVKEARELDLSHLTIRPGEEEGDKCVVNERAATPDNSRAASRAAVKLGFMTGGNVSDKSTMFKQAIDDLAGTRSMNGVEGNLFAHSVWLRFVGSSLARRGMAEIHVADPTYLSYADYEYGYQNRVMEQICIADQNEVDQRASDAFCTYTSMSSAERGTDFDLAYFEQVAKRSWADDHDRASRAASAAFEAHTLCTQPATLEYFAERTFTDCNAARLKINDISTPKTYRGLEEHEERMRLDALREDHEKICPLSESYNNKRASLGVEVESRDAEFASDQKRANGRLPKRSKF